MGGASTKIKGPEQSQGQSCRDEYGQREIFARKEVGQPRVFTAPFYGPVDAESGAQAVDLKGQKQNRQSQPTPPFGIFGGLFFIVFPS